MGKTIIYLEYFSVFFLQIIGVGLLIVGLIMIFLGINSPTDLSLPFGINVSTSSLGVVILLIGLVLLIIRKPIVKITKEKEEHNNLHE